jgi:raffinose/stachyose/melibiose transport system substrate-binding protein
MKIGRGSVFLILVLAALSWAQVQERTQVTMWLETGAGGICTLNHIIAPFNAQSDTIEVVGTMQAAYWDATRTALAGGAGPDIVGTPGPSFVFELARAGKLLPLDEFAEEFGWSQNIFGWALDLGRLDGTLYSIPDSVETIVLYYNKTLFEERGWELPTTMDELVALTAQIQAEGVIPFAHSNAEWRPANEHYVGEFLNQVAGPEKVYEALIGERPWTDPEFVRAIELLNRMQQEGWFMGGLDRYYTTPTDEMLAALGDGKAAMAITGTWFIGTMDDFFGEEAGNANEWDVMPVPSSTGEVYFSVGLGHTLSINRNSANPRAAAEFLTYFYSPETQARRVVECGEDPGPVALDIEALEGADPRHARILEGMEEAFEAGNYGYTTWTFWPPRSNVYIWEEIERVWAGRMTAEQYLAGLQRIFDEELAAGVTLPIPAR